MENCLNVNDIVLKVGATVVPAVLEFRVLADHTTNRLHIRYRTIRGMEFVGVVKDFYRDESRFIFDLLEVEQLSPLDHAREDLEDIVNIFNLSFGDWTNQYNVGANFKFTYNNDGSKQLDIDTIEPLKPIDPQDPRVDKYSKILEEVHEQSECGARVEPACSGHCGKCGHVGEARGDETKHPGVSEETSEPSDK